MAKQRRGEMTSPRGMAEIELIFRYGVEPLSDPEPEIREAIRNMRRDALEAIDPKQAAQIISDKEKTGSADAAYFAALLHEQLARVEDCLRQLLTCPAADARLRGLMLAGEMDTSRFYWQRLLLIENEKLTTAGMGTSRGGKKTAALKRDSMEGRPDQMCRDWSNFRASGYSKGEADEAVARAFKVSEKTVRTARKNKLAKHS